MILTVTLNPSIDTTYVLDELQIDGVNRAVPAKTAGGKGLNVARVLAQLGAETTALGLAGGHMGALLAALALADGIACAFSPIAGETRTCVNILHGGNQTEILESGPEVSAEELAGFMAQFSAAVAAADCVAISGSLPQGVPSFTYARLVTLGVSQGVPVLLDTSGAALEAALAAPVKPTLIKPNLSEVNALLGAHHTVDDLPALQASLARDPRFTGVSWIVVTLGAAGAVAFHEGRGYRVEAPRIACANATGSGDATVAGLAFALAAGMDDEELLRHGIACGTLNALDPKTGHLALEAWERIFTQTVVASL